MKNGFLALAEFDKTANGGNSDGVIDNNDSVFGNLRLWQDLNHNGILESSELHKFSDFGLKILFLDFKLSKKTDEYGNEFKYRLKSKTQRMRNWGAGLGMCSCSVPGIETYKLEEQKSLAVSFLNRSLVLV